VFWYGAVAFAFGIANFFGSPILGGLSDRYGRRPVLLLGFCGLALNFFATALATALWVLVAVRLVGGAMQANISVANAYVADITPPEDRAERFALLGAMFGIGFVIGPAVGGVLGGIDIHLPFFVAGSLALLNLLYGYFVLPESLPADRRRRFDWTQANPVAALRNLTALRGVGMLVVVIALSGFAQFLLHTSWVLYTKFKFGWGPSQTGWSLGAVGIMSILVQGVLMKHLLKRFTPQRLAVLGLISSSVCFLLWGLATEGWMMFAIIFCNLLGFTAQSAIQSIVSGAADSLTQGRTLGAVGSLNSLMAVVAPIVGAGMMGVVAHRPPGDWLLGLPMFFCAGLQAVAMLIAMRHFAAERRAAAGPPPSAPLPTASAPAPATP
jgi:DHA1 family tetracycline resistance protein-like MFS transporter